MVKALSNSEIARKLVISIVLFSSSVTLVITGFQLYSEYKKDIQRIGLSIDMVEASYLPSLVNSLWEINSTQVNIILKGILSLPGMEYIEIKKNGKRKAFIGRLKSKHIIEKEFPLIIRLKHKNVQLGVLRVVNSLDLVHQQLIDRALTILVGNAVKTFFVSIFIFIFIQLKITRRLTRVANYTQGLDFDHMEKSPAPFENESLSGRQDEIHKIITAVNLMHAKIHRELSRRHRAEKTLLESKERYQNLFDEAPVPLWEEDFTEALNAIEELKNNGVGDFRNFFDKNPSLVKSFAQKVKIINVNNEALKLHEAGSKEDLICSLDKIFTEGSLKAFKEELIAIASGADTFETDGEVGTLTGSLKHIHLKLILDKKNQDKKMALLSTLDITERKRAEIENMRLQQKLVQAQKMEAIGTLAGGIAHDFNNILYPIIGMAELLMEDLSPESSEHENAAEIFGAGMRGAQLVKQILSFSRQHEHKMIPVRLQKILREVLKLSRSSIPSNIEICENIDQDCPLISADPAQMHQVAMNLITNAYHAVGTKNGIIDIELKPAIIDSDGLPGSSLIPGEYARLSVSDNGSGIDSKIMGKIFEPYFTTKENEKGTGLGLAVVHGIIRAHHGEIKVYSDRGKGTVFNVYLPLLKKTKLSHPEEAEADLETGSESILLVDDEASVANLQSQMLSRLGYRVVRKTESKKALELFAADPKAFDLVITDMTMPNMTGNILAEKILSIRPGTPIIICTGFSAGINKKQAGDLGIKGFLMKPVIKTDMARMVRDVLDESKKM